MLENGIIAPIEEALLERQLGHIVGPVTLLNTDPMIRASLENPESPFDNGARIINIRSVLRKLWAII